MSHDGCVGEVDRDDLPPISEEEARELIDDIVDLLSKKHGYRRVDAKGAPIGNGATKGNDHDPDAGAE